MPRPDGNVHEIPGTRDHRLVAESKGALPFEHVECLVLISVDMQWWATPGRYDRLHGEVGPHRLRASDQKPVEVSGTPIRSSSPRRTMEQRSRFGQRQIPFVSSF